MRFPEKSVSMKIALVPLLLMLLIFSGCTGPSKTWTSSPAFQTAGNPYFRVRFEALKKEHNFYILFQLEVTNLSDRTLQVDWNKTRYLLDGKNHGGFVFAGIDPQAIKTASIPLDEIPAGGVFSREIAPYKLLAMAPFRDKTVDAGQTRISPGLLPAGENGIALFITRDGEPIVEKMALTIETGTGR